MPICKGNWNQLNQLNNIFWRAKKRAMTAAYEAAMISSGMVDGLKELAMESIY